MENVTKILIILSGKGGVGKSSVTCMLTHSMIKQGLKVGVIDLDICGPSIPLMLGVDDLKTNKITQSQEGWLPIKVTENLYCLSIHYLLKNKSDSIVWRGPKKTGLINQFFNQTKWPIDLDYLVIDTPPGTSDEHIAMISNLEKYMDKTSAILVTTPQEKYDLFSKGGGAVLAKEYSLELLGCIPIDSNLSALIDTLNKEHSEEGFVKVLSRSTLCEHFDSIVRKYLNTLPSE